MGDAIAKSLKKGHALEYLPRNMLDNCDDYFTRRLHFYNTEPVTEFEENFPIAFSLLVYHEFDQLEQMLLALYRRQNFYCIHVDNSSSEQFKSLVSTVALTSHYLCCFNWTITNQ